MTNILDTIVKTKRERLDKSGSALGFDVPAKRQHEIIPFTRDPFLICEIKRKSPSKGNISMTMDVIQQAGFYKENLIKSVSVLTEQDHFAGSLDDLMSIKKRFPDLSLLRKDFLLTEDEVEVSFRAGADAVLLIAAILEKELLYRMYRRAVSLGITALVEVHDEADVEKVRDLKPVLTGINARDLKSFSIDLALPLNLKRSIDWNTTLVFESGIHSREQARFALSGGFGALLVGESVVKNPGLIPELKAAFSDPMVKFWNQLYQKKPPYVKICGITNKEDAYFAAQSGADILGFIFADSKRKANPALLHELRGLDVLKAAVVITSEYNPPALNPEVAKLLEAGLIDVVQFHGAETPDDCCNFAFPYYKAVTIKEESDIKLIEGFRSPRVLVDAWSQSAKGGTGKQIPDSLIQKIKASYPLWIAGGLDPGNVKSVLNRFEPELIDASSRLELQPGKKDNQLVAAFIKEIKGE